MGALLFYGKTRIQVLAQDENFWMPQKGIAELFGVDLSGVARHLGNIFNTGELNEEAVIAKIAITASDGKTYQTKHSNLDAIIAVGYRVNSHQASIRESSYGANHQG